MSLLETVFKRLDKVGAIPKVIRSLPKISLLLTITGILVIFNLAVSGNFRGTYISENALMPSQAYSFFRESEWNFVRGYREEVKSIMFKSGKERNEALDNWLMQIGYKTSKYSYVNPMNNRLEQTTYAIYHTPRGDDTEAMVLVAPWHTTDDQINIGGISLVMGLARYFYRLSIWSKNIIIVFPEDGQDSLKLWVDAYHKTLENTGGSIESAVVVEYPSDSDGCSYIELDYVGINGELPNLDLINCAVTIGEHEGFKFSLHNTPHGQLWTNDFSSRVTTLFKSIFELATAGILPIKQGGGNGCEAFSGWNIQTITLRAIGNSGKDITTFGRVIEGLFRSVNNLLEKFHQSYFFYLLLAPRSFVSISNYLPASILGAGSFMLSSVSSLLLNSNYSNYKTFASSASKDYNWGLVKLQTNVLTIGFSIFTIVLCVFSVICFSSMYFFADTVNSKLVDYESNQSLRLYSMFYFLVGLILPLLSLTGFKFIKNINSKISISQLSRFLLTFSLFYLGVGLIALQVIHFALAFLISIICLPLLFIRYGDLQSSSKNKFINFICLFVTCPSTVIFALGIFNSIHFELDYLRNFIQYFRYELVQKLIQDIIDIDYSQIQIFNNVLEILFGLIKAYSRFQCYTWIFICIFWYPVWLCALIVTLLPSESDYAETEEKKNN
ncbi:hypothetical protein BVG19_g3036 [[Candida] boidinii]|nr:hypothetical protein BVG19_g3036 [[Candida] boidinii]OWB50036.1 hypothetical protein B5S27_g1582 [[Candida] boidinii]